MALAVPQKTNLDGLISDLLSEKVVSVLERDNQLVLGTITLHLVTKRIPLRHAGPVLAAWTDIAQVKVLAGSFHTSGLIYLPWQEDELPAFRKLYPDAQPLPTTKAGDGV